MSPYRTMHHIKKLIDGDTGHEEKTKIVKWHFPDWEVDEDFFENLTDGEMLDMIYDMATNSLKQEEAV
jgi:hypothetical protein